MNPGISDFRSGGQGPSEKVRQTVRRLVPDGAHGFDRAELTQAAAVVLARNDPLRDSIVLREAKCRREARTPAAEAAWEQIKIQAADVLEHDTYRLWFEPLSVVGEHDGALLLSGPRHVCRWVGRRYPELMATILSRCSDFTEVLFEPVEGLR